MFNKLVFNDINNIFIKVILLKNYNFIKNIKTILK